MNHLHYFSGLFNTTNHIAIISQDLLASSSKIINPLDEFVKESLSIYNNEFLLSDDDDEYQEDSYEEEEEEEEEEYEEEEEEDEEEEDEDEEEEDEDEEEEDEDEEEEDEDEEEEDEDEEEEDEDEEEEDEDEEEEDEDDEDEDEDDEEEDEDDEDEDEDDEEEDEDDEEYTAEYEEVSEEYYEEYFEEYYEVSYEESELYTEYVYDASTDLTEVAAEYYPNEDFYYIIEDANNTKNKKPKAGKKLQLPSLQAYVGRLKLQYLLTYLGYKLGTLDGVVGKKTKAAIKKFQKDHKLGATGNLDDKTSRKLRDEFRKKAKDLNAFDVQIILNYLGYNFGAIDGIWGKKSDKALQQFQANNKIAKTGELDKKTFTALVDSFV